MRPLLAKAAAWLADDTYPHSQAAGALKRMSGPEGVGIMLREQVEPFAESAKALCRTLPKSEQGISKPRRKPERITPRRDDVAYLSDQRDQRHAEMEEQRRFYVAKARSLPPEVQEHLLEELRELAASTPPKEGAVIPLRGLPRRPGGDNPRPAA